MSSRRSILNGGFSFLIKFASKSNASFSIFQETSQEHKKAQILNFGRLAVCQFSFDFNKISDLGYFYLYLQHILRVQCLYALLRKTNKIRQMNEDDYTVSTCVYMCTLWAHNSRFGLLKHKCITSLVWTKGKQYVKS